MELKISYSATHKKDEYPFTSSELAMRVTKAEAFQVCRDNFVYHYPSGNEVVKKVIARAKRKARSVILEEYGFRHYEYTLEVELKPNESNLFSNAFIAEFFRWLLEDAYKSNCTIYNDAGLSDFFYAAIQAFSEFYDGDLTADARAIQARIASA